MFMIKDDVQSGGLYVTLWNTKCRFCDIIQPTGIILFSNIVKCSIIPRKDHFVLQYAVVVQLFNMQSGQLIFVHKIFLLLPL